MNFSHSYSQLGKEFFQRVLPTPVTAPQLLLFNQELAQQLQLKPSLIDDSKLLAQYFSGNLLPEQANAIALAYAGHQFGGFNPQLGDGRAHLLGELIDQSGNRFDIQLKGSGQTPYSRQGDGRCPLGPAIREFIMSEAMFHLNVPTTRCLAVVATGDPVYRQQTSPGAVVTRVASSHIRVGTFQYFSAQGDRESLAKLIDYTISRHFEDIADDDPERVVKFLNKVIDKQIDLIIEWLRVGFIHGVMNTDNTLINGETIDFGPCAMMGTYHPGTVYSSIDSQGRYAFGNQAQIANWNMARFAETLIPFIDNDQEQAISLVQEIIYGFVDQFNQKYQQMLACKLGVKDNHKFDHQVAKDILQAMQEKSLDYTLTFVQLAQSLTDKDVADKLNSQLGKCYQQWREQLNTLAIDAQSAQRVMQQTNPLVIPRNHHVEQVLAECENGNIDAAIKFIQVLKSPYEQLTDTHLYQDLPIDNDAGYRTFCGT